MTANLIETRRALDLMVKTSFSPVPCFLSKVRNQGAVVVGGWRHPLFAAALARAAPVVVFAGRCSAGASFPGLRSLRDLSRDWNKKYWRYGKSQLMPVHSAVIVPLCREGFLFLPCNN
jgi:hypothetical protein